ncbi:MAG: prepilin-type N-terminal cleavage/methylation domain-containing protein [Bacilli bacterium]
MKKNKGFTLIEVIGVIIILSIIILTVVPIVLDSLSDSKETLFKTQIEEIESAAKAWGVLNSNNLPKEEGNAVITLLQLKLSNLIAFDIKNPKTGNLFPDDMKIEIERRGLNLFYTVMLDTGTSNEIINVNAPQLVLNGTIIQNVEINDKYIEFGAEAKDKKGNSVLISKVIKTSNNQIVNVISTDKLQKYFITYLAITKDKQTSSITREVNIRDITKPIITIPDFTSGQVIDLESNSNFSLPRATIKDNSKELLEAYIYGNFSLRVPGLKKVIYKATDSSGNSDEFILNYNIKDTIVPFASATLSINSVLKRAIITVTASDDGVGLHEYAYSFDDGLTWKKENTYIVENLPYNSTIKIRDKALNIKTISKEQITSV